MVAINVILIGLIIGITLELGINKLIKEMRTKIRDNTKEIKDFFSERWDRAEAMFMSQACDINILRAREPQTTSKGLTITLNGATLNTDNFYRNCIVFSS